jgi:hypothetical protein
MDTALYFLVSQPRFALTYFDSVNARAVLGVLIIIIVVIVMNLIHDVFVWIMKFVIF